MITEAKTEGRKKAKAFRGENKGVKWTIKYGGVVASVYETGTADGMNEQGLVAVLLFLVESEYPSDKNDTRPQASIAAWAQYFLDSFATVEEAVADMQKEIFRPVVVVAPNFKEAEPFEFLAPH